MLVKYRGKRVSFIFSEDGRKWHLPQEAGEIIVLCCVNRDGGKDANPFVCNNWRYFIVDIDDYKGYGWDSLPEVSVKTVCSRVFPYDNLEMAQFITDELIDIMNVPVGKVNKWKRAFVREMRRLGKEMPWKNVTEEYVQESLGNCDDRSIRDWITKGVKAESCAYEAVCFS